MGALDIIENLYRVPKTFIEIVEDAKTVQGIKIMDVITK